MRHYSQATDAFYRESMAHILKEPPPPLPEELWDETGYAIARMLMLSRKGGSRLDDALREALFLALKSAERCASPKARRARRAVAARAALKLGRGVPLKERARYFDGCGAAAGCIARLLYRDEV